MAAKQQGRVEAVHVQEGDMVEEGQLLAQMAPQYRAAWPSGRSPREVAQSTPEGTHYSGHIGALARR